MIPFVSGNRSMSFAALLLCAMFAASCTTVGAARAGSDVAWDNDSSRLEESPLPLVS